MLNRAPDGRHYVSSATDYHQLRVDAYAPLSDTGQSKWATLG